MKFLDTEDDIKGYAEKISESIVIRTYDNGNSKDTRRPATPEESRTIAGIVSGALLSVKWGSAERDVKQHEKALQQAADTAEFIAHSFLPDANSYDTVYRPIKEFSWQEEIVKSVDFAGRKENQKCSEFLTNTIHECSESAKYGVNFDAKAAVQKMLNEFPEERVAQVIAHQVIPGQNYIDNPDFVDGRYSKKVSEWAKNIIANDENHNFKNFDFCSSNAHPVLINALAEKFIENRELDKSRENKPSVLGQIKKIKEQKVKEQPEEKTSEKTKSQGQEL